MSKIVYSPTWAQVDFYNQGVAFQTETFKPVHEIKPGKRGKVVRWSSASRRRMRKYMLTHVPPNGWGLYGATFTVPGPPLSPDRCRKLWKLWADLAAYKHGWAVVWRVELQQRGQVHWHCLVSAANAKPAQASRVDETMQGYLTVSIIRRSWEDALRSLGPQHWDKPYVLRDRKGVVYGELEGVRSLMSIPGALEYASQVQTNQDNSGAWLRYLQDHSSKAKQAQGGWVGRHWGVLNRKLFLETEPHETVKMSGRQYARFLRAYRRMIMYHRACCWYDKTRRRMRHCPHIKKCSAVGFGGCLAWGSTRGRYGSSVWFSRPGIVRRLALWAVGESD